MTIDPTSAAAAYAKIAQGAAAPASNGDKPEGLNFSELVKEAIGQVVETGHASEQKMTEAVNGQAPLIDVVTAVTTAEMTLETVTAVRDRMIAAYQDVVKMPI